MNITDALLIWNIAGLIPFIMTGFWLCRKAFPTNLQKTVGILGMLIASPVVFVFLALMAVAEAITQRRLDVFNILTEEM